MGAAVFTDEISYFEVGLTIALRLLNKHKQNV